MSLMICYDFLSCAVEGAKYSFLIELLPCDVLASTSLVPTFSLVWQISLIIQMVFSLWELVGDDRDITHIYPWDPCGGLSCSGIGVW